MTPTEKLARAMGYETRTDFPGYGVTRVLIKVGELGSWQVFNPLADGLQCFEVLAWTINQSASDADEKPTGLDLMRAVCDAAERVVEGMV